MWRAQSLSCRAVQGNSILLVTIKAAAGASIIGSSRAAAAVTHARHFSSAAMLQGPAQGVWVAPKASAIQQPVRRQYLSTAVLMLTIQKADCGLYLTAACASN